MKFVIIDYGMGNIKSIISAFKYLKVDDIIVSNKYEDIKNADKLLLPGVGSFTKAMENIYSLNLKDILEEIVFEDKKPILGICLGMQLLCNNSQEDGGSTGLNFVDGNCERFKSNDIKVPHVGFNQVGICKDTILFDGIDNYSDFYFTHSYRLNSKSNINPSTCTYGEEFIASYEFENIFGTQFHPELSQINGLKLLKNFIEKV